MTSLLRHIQKTGSDDVIIDDVTTNSTSKINLDKKPASDSLDPILSISSIELVFELKVLVN